MTGPELFDGQMLFFTEPQRAVQREIDRGKKLEDLVFEGPDDVSPGVVGNLKTNTELPATVQHWISTDRLPIQVSNTYEQLTRGN